MTDKHVEDDLSSSVLQLRILADEGAKVGGQTSHSREAKHSPLVMTPGGSFTKAKSRVSFSPGDDGDDLEEGDEDDEQSVLGAVAQVRAASGSATEAVVPELDEVGQPSVLAKTHTISLFGGAIATILPVAFEDVSTIRQVPDHQEVFVDRNSEMSFIVELVSYDEDVSDADAPGHYFADLGQCNEAKNVCVDSKGIIPAEARLTPLLTDRTTVRCAITGRQTVSKFRREDAPLEVVQIILVVIRLPHVGTDMLLSVNVPFAEDRPPIGVEDVVRAVNHRSPDDGSNSSSSSSSSSSTSSSSSSSGSSGDSVAPAISVMATALQSLQVHNWSLFA